MRWFASRAELGTEHGTVKRVAEQLGMGSSRCGRGCARPTSMGPEGRPVGGGRGVDPQLQQRNRELERANKILKKASAYFAQAELDRP